MVFFRYIFCKQFIALSQVCSNEALFILDLYGLKIKFPILLHSERPNLLCHSECNSVKVYYCENNGSICNTSTTRANKVQLEKSSASYILSKYICTCIWSKWSDSSGRGRTEYSRYPSLSLSLSLSKIHLFKTIERQKAKNAFRVNRLKTNFVLQSECQSKISKLQTQMKVGREAA